MRLASLRSVLTLGLLLHAAIALLFVPGLTDLYRRGNPIVGYPFAVYGLLAGRAFTARNDAPTEDRRAWGWLAGLFLVCSIGAVFPLSKLAPYIDRVSPRWVYDGTYATYIFVIPAVLLLAGRLCGWQHRPLQGALAAFAVLLFLRLPGPIWWLDALIPALVVYLWTFVFLTPAATRAASVAASRSEPPLPA
jgi:hypothetical protein